MLGTITCKKRELNSDPYTYGELYIHDVVVTVKKAIYDQYQVGDEVDFNYTDHVSFSGVKFHNLSDIKKIGTQNFKIDKSISQKLNNHEIDFYINNQSEFFFWIKVSFFSLILFFFEMYFVARFELDLQIQKSTGKNYLLVFLFAFLFTINFLLLIPLFKKRELSRIRNFSKFIRRVKVIEYVQNSDNCDFYFQDSSGTSNTQISMSDFHKVKNNPVLDISFINNELFYELSISEETN